MTKIVKVAILMLSVTSFLSAWDFPDLTRMKPIVEVSSVQVYSEDSSDYSKYTEIIRLTKYQLDSMFGPRQNIKIFVYPGIKELSEQGMGNSWGYEHGVTGFANPTKSHIYVASFYDKTRDSMYLLRVPAHELVHLYFNSSHQWLYEGMAHYLGKLIVNFKTPDEVAAKLSDLVFFGEDNNRTMRTYNNCGWMAKFIFEDRLNSDIKRLIAFSKSKEPFVFLGFKSDSDFFREYQDYISKKGIAS